jgi:hypothetical protein
MTGERGGGPARLLLVSDLLVNLCCVVLLFLYFGPCSRTSFQNDWESRRVSFNSSTDRSSELQT